MKQNDLKSALLTTLFYFAVACVPIMLLRTEYTLDERVVVASAVFVVIFAFAVAFKIISNRHSGSPSDD